jgi:ATP-dependent phosphoenolpyruvate carboxykinase
MTERNRDKKNNLVDNLPETPPRVFSDLSQQKLICQVQLRNEGQLTRIGSVVVITGEITG